MSLLSLEHKIRNEMSQMEWNWNWNSFVETFSFDKNFALSFKATAEQCRGNMSPMQNGVAFVEH